MNKFIPDRAIKEAGGPKAISILFAIKIQSVMAWKRNLPDARLRVLECLFPEIFPPRIALKNAGRRDLDVLGVEQAFVQKWLGRARKKGVDAAIIARVLELYPELANEPESVAQQGGAV